MAHQKRPKNFSNVLANPDLMAGCALALAYEAMGIPPPHGHNQPNQALIRWYADWCLAWEAGEEIAGGDEQDPDNTTDSTTAGDTDTGADYVDNIIRAFGT